MNTGEEVSYDSFVEAYCLLSSYLREDGKIGAKYNTEYLKEFVTFLSKVMTDPTCFDRSVVVMPERNEDGSLKIPELPDHDGTGLAQKKGEQYDHS